MDVVAFISSISADILGMVGIVVLLFALGLARGKKFLLTFLLALYPSALVTAQFPFYTHLQGMGVRGVDAIAPLLVLGLSIVTTMWVIRRYVNAGYQERTFWRVVETATLSIAGAGLLLALLYHVASLEPVYNFGPAIDALFSSSLAFFAWLIAPIVGIQLFVRP